MIDFPYFPFYVSDWLADANVMQMSMAGEGCYIHLLAICWRERSIPADRSAIALLCKNHDGPAVDEALKCFKPVPGNPDRLYNKRLEEERKKMMRHHNLKKIAGLTGAKKRWQSHPSANSKSIARGAKALPLAKHSSSSSSSSSYKEEDKSSSLCPESNKKDIDLTQALIDGILANNPEASVIKHLTPKRRHDWEDQCRLLRERDGRTPEEILAVIQFSQADDFWKGNILSMPKLREKWDQLFLKAKFRGKGSGGYVRDEGARHVKLTPAEETEEEKLRVEYKAELNKFLKERGYKSDEEMSFDELTSWSFERFKAQKKKEAKKP